jgi:hypothetical protein
MKFIEKTVEKLLNTPFEDFTSFSILCVSMAKSDEHFNKKDLKDIEWLIANVNNDLQTSIYKLDRFVDPLQLSNNPTKYSYPIKFRSDNIKEEDSEDKKQLSRKSEDLQRELCEAIEKINAIMFKHLSRYNEDFIMPTQNNDSKEEDFE